MSHDPLGIATDDEVLARYADEDVERGGREAAFHELVSRYRRRVYGICYRYFGDHADAEEATQETFVLLVRRAGQFRGDSKLSTWIYRITVNACHDLARRDARRPRTPVADVAAVAGAVPDPSSSPPELAVADELAHRLREALGRLDEVSRACVILGPVEGRPYAEVAAILDMPVGTVKSRIHRARARLAELLEADEPAGGSGGTGGAGRAPESAPRRQGRQAGSGAPRAPPGEEP